MNDWGRLSTMDMSGFGAHSAQEVEQFQKALAISQNYGTTAPGSLSGGSALSVEDLDRTLKLVTNSLEHLRLWKDILKQRVTQVVGEFNVTNSYGDEVSPFFAMGSNPQGTDSNYEREIYRVKYLGTQGSVLHDLTMIQAAHGPVIARETKQKTIELLSRNERAMFDADSSINSLEYDGIFAQMVAKEGSATYKATSMAGYDEAGSDESVIIDGRSGASLGLFDDDFAEKLALTNVNAFGRAKDCYMPTDMHSKFSRDFYAAQRTDPGKALVSGQKVPSHSGSLDYDFKPSLFNRPRKSPLGVAVSASAAPTLASMASPADGASEFVAADLAGGAISYVVSAVFADGETLPSSEINASISAGDKVTIDISYTGSPLYLNVFRAVAGAAVDHLFIGRIAATSSGATYDVDFNAILPGSGKAYLMWHDSEVFCWKQLGSLIKYDLAVTTTSYQWLQLMYGTPLISAARKLTIGKNLESKR